MQIRINQQIFKINFSMVRTIKLIKMKMPASSNIQRMAKLKMVLLQRGKMAHRCQIRHNRWKAIEIANWKIVKFRINRLKKLRKMKKSCQSIITTCKSKPSIITIRVCITITEAAMLKKFKGRTSSQNQPNSLASRPHCKARTKSSTTSLNNNPPTPPRTSPLVPSTTTSSMNKTSKSRDNSNINKRSSPFQANTNPTKTRC